MMRNWPMQHGGRSTCGMAGLWTTQAVTRDRTAGVPEHRVSPLAIGADVSRLRRWRSGDDRTAVHRRGDAFTGAERETGWRRRCHGAPRGTGHRSDEDGRHRRTVLLDRPRVFPVQAGIGFATL